MPTRETALDLFSQPVDALVNPVNLVGVSGAGLAKRFAVDYPMAQKEYVEACQNEWLEFGKVLVAKALMRRLHIIYAPTKDHWKNPSLFGNVALTVVAIAEAIQEHKFGRVAIPALGCGNGGLLWEADGRAPGIRDLLHEVLGPLEADIAICPPRGVQPMRYIH